MKSIFAGFALALLSMSAFLTPSTAAEPIGIPTTYDVLHVDSGASTAAVHREQPFAGLVRTRTLDRHGSPVIASVNIPRSELPLGGSADDLDLFGTPRAMLYQRE